MAGGISGMMAYIAASLRYCYDAEEATGPEKAGVERDAAATALVGHTEYAMARCVQMDQTAACLEAGSEAEKDMATTEVDAQPALVVKFVLGPIPHSKIHCCGRSQSEAPGRALPSCPPSSSYLSSVVVPSSVPSLHPSATPSSVQGHGEKAVSSQSPHAAVDVAVQAAEPIAAVHEEVVAAEQTVNVGAACAAVESAAAAAAVAAVALAVLRAK